MRSHEGLLSLQSQAKRTSSLGYTGNKKTFGQHRINLQDKLLRKFSLADYLYFSLPNDGLTSRGRGVSP